MIHEKFDMSVRASGQLTVQLISPSGQVVLETVSKNSIVYGGADIMASLLSGNLTNSINTMYMQFYNAEEVYSPPAVSRADGISYFTSQLGPINHDYIRVQTVGSPVVAASTSNYSGNKVVFTAYSGTPDTGELGQNFTAGTSKVYGGGLVLSQSQNSSSSDLLFARATTSQITLVTGHQVAMRWTITFL
jgi:hypothetical protein